ncbi:transposase [uncultured Cohaesibacter sp.]|uniref:transposase n=1 Tax=uncultured Cohaesibacter sp. TaxID=1002546 RepID=UPI0029C83F6A|nr:transposase [uncultured Cohaesibacter sp.]
MSSRSDNPPAIREVRPFLPGLSPVDRHALEACVDGGTLSSDDKALLLHEIERKLGFADMIASCLHDMWDPRRTAHDYANMISARMFAICCG